MSLLGLLALAFLTGGHAWGFFFSPFLPYSGYYVPQTYFKFGAVYARSIVPGPNGQPVYVELDPDTGEEGREIAEATGDWAGLQVLAGSEYRAWLERLADLRETYPELELVSAETYQGAGYTTVDGEPVTKPTLAPETRYAALLPAALRYLPDGELVLLELPIDPNEPLNGDTRALILDPETGAIRHQSPDNIGFRVGFYGNEEDPTKQPYVGSDWRRKPDDTIYGPLKQVPLEVGFYGGGLTDDEGRFHFQYHLPPCPGFTFSYTTPLYLELHYKRFNPRGSERRPYFMRRPGYDFCNGLGIYSPAAAAIVATSATPVRYPSDFLVDLMVLSGGAYLANDSAQIPLAEAIAFDHEQGPLERVAQQTYDLDGDGEPDWSRLGREEEIDGEVQFVPMAPEENPPLQGVWLSSVHGGAPGADAPPDLTRLADWSADFQDRGLLSQLSEEDLQNTDLYIFRESDGSLIAERKGLDAHELVAAYSGVDTDTNRFRYTVHLLGDSFSSFYAGGNFSFGLRTELAEWQAAGGLDPRFHERQADHLRAGEQVRLIAINRASGYIGSLTTELQAAGSGAVSTEISFPIEDLVLRPPNLKVWAERQYEVEYGLTKGDDRDYLIGQEGAAEAGDTVVTLYSEWYDRDGRPLPEDLADYGYIARLAQVVAENSLQEVGAVSEGGENLAHFPIKPGRQIQVVRLPERNLGNQHLYLQVNGVPHTRTPDFGSGEGQGILTHRPGRYVPVQVPVFDEDTTGQQTQVYNQLRQAYDEGTLSEEPTEPEPVYRWAYRPELQFSIYDLTLREVRRRDLEGEVENVLTFDEPVLSTGDALVELFYELLGPEFPPLVPYSYQGERELVFAFGEKEIAASVGPDRTLALGNLEHLAALDPADFLSLRLYSNNDAANVLFEWAFLAVTLLPERNGELSHEENEIRITADEAAEAPLTISAFVNGAQGDEPLRMKWDLLGDGSLSPTAEANPKGIFDTQLTLPPVTDASAMISARLQDSPGALYSATYRVIPGEPRQITVSASGETAIGGLGGVDLEIEVLDAYGNPVADETQISVEAESLAVSGSTALQDGHTSLTLRGALEPGEHSVRIRAGEAETTQTILVHDVTLSFSGVGDVAIDSNATFTIQAESSYPDMEGLEIEVAAHRGRLGSYRVALDASGTASVGYGSGAFRGFAQVSAKIVGTERIATQDFSVVETENYLERNVIVSDGSGTIDLGDGQSFEYGSTTALVVSADEGEEVDASLVDVEEPPLYALQDFSDGVLDPVAGKLADASSGIDAHVDGVQRTASDLPGEYAALAFADDARMEVPDHNRLGELSEAGVNLNLRLDALNEDTADQILVDWDSLGIRIELDGGDRVRLRARTAAGEIVFVHPEALQAGSWHGLVVHHLDGKLHLGVDGDVRTLELAAALDPADDQDYALGLFAPQTQMQVAGLRLYDWHGEAKLTFGDGSFAMTAVGDAQGRARLPVEARPALLAYTRPYQDTEGLFAAILDGLVPGAYAATPAEDACTAAMAPIPPDAEDRVIRQAEQFMNTILECFIRTRIEQARIEVETSRGFFGKGVAIVKSATLEGVYTVLKQQKNNAIVVANCLDAAITGNNASAVGTACDFVTSMLAIGDVRDLIIQGWHYFFANPEDFDALTASLAGVGIVASIAQLAGGAGVAPTALVAAGKTIAKFLKRIGPAGVKAAKVLGDFIGAIVRHPSLSTGGKIERLTKFLPVFEIGASVALLYAHEPRLFELLGHAMSTPDKFARVSDWMQRYLERLEGELTALVEQRRDWLDYFISSAYAVGLSSAVKDKFINGLRKIVERLDNVPIKEVADDFDLALEQFIEVSTNPSVRNALAEVTDDTYVLKSFMNIGEIADTDGMRRFASNGGWNIGMEDVFKTEHLVKAIADMRVDRLTRTPAQLADALPVENADQVITGLRGLASQFDHPWGFSLTKGHIGHFLIAADLLNAGAALKGVEVRDIAVTLANGVVLPLRRADIEVQIGSKLFYWEIKNFASTTWSKNLGTAMSTKVAKHAEEVLEEVLPGQLLTDLGKLYREISSGSPTHLRQWVFTPSVLGIRTRPTASQFAEMEQTITNRIVELIENPKSRELLSKHLGMGADATEEQIDDALDELIEIVEGSHSAVSGGMVKVYPFDNLVPTGT